jgi:hypothetical protein
MSKFESSKVKMTTSETPFPLPAGNLPNSPDAAQIARRWALANPWLAEGQADDRTPMDGSVKDIVGPPSEQRAFARRRHQLMFKEWSQARHD